MKNLKIKVSHTTFIISAIAIWVFIGLGMLKSFNLEEVTVGDMTTMEVIVVCSAMFISFMGILLLANLLSYIFIAKVLNEPRHTMERVIAERAEADSREKNYLIQRFYVWCLDVAYGKK